MCEQLGQEPDPAKMPLESSSFPEEVQVAFFVYGLLPDRWDGMSGTYLGKDWNCLNHIFELYEIDNQKEVFFFSKIYENLVVSFKAEEAEKKRKAEERKAKSAGGGKQFTHNVRS
jgi:hypothetical protein|tara:strand:- start:106 stop:450 length:345 start_codon:yes stop_codon:yes gene_type:complete